MSTRTGFGRGFLLLALIVFVLQPSFAEDVEKKFRIGLSFGGYNNQGEISSDAANELTLVDARQNFSRYFYDPRDDSSVFGNLDIQSGPVATLSAQYAFSKVFIVEASVGYNRNDVGEIEVQAQFAGTVVPDLRRFDFRTFRIPAGDLTRVPLQLTGIARFRPRASFNPYFGAGIGYTFVGFEPSSEFDALSANMDASLGGQSRLTEATYGNPTLSISGLQIGDLDGAAVRAEDSFEWNIVGGAEFSFKRKWVAFLDLRWTFASQALEFQFNGGNYLGVPVPELTDYEFSQSAYATYGAIWITTGGLVDGGSLQWRPREGELPTFDCFTGPEPDSVRCIQAFDHSQPDGQVDPGFYYVQGGTVEYGGVGLQIGVRYTF